MKDKDALILESLYGNIRILENTNISGMKLPPGFKNSSIIKPFDELNVAENDKQVNEPTQQKPSVEKPEVDEQEDDVEETQPSQEEEVKESKKYKTLEG